ncbi:acyl-CoA dehydrogenase family protein [Candidatus Palauibacter sp.]|uniref:acyl-CoA dehydrogenase family protein n=1 Tax=Candidatus Palauibacter sp. TaxID=3101350 RepID=UPI003B52E606
MGDEGFYLEDHHEMIREMVREFAEAEIAPVAARYDESEDFPWDTGALMAELGLFGIPFEEGLGGAGMDLLAASIAVEELARVDASHSIMIGAHTSLAATPIDRWGTEAQKERFLRPLASGRVLGGFGLTEPGSGSDAGAMRTTARKAGDRWIINGSKTWITHGGVGEVFVVGALTSPDKGSRGVTAFVLTKETCDLEDAARVGFGHAADLDPMPGFSAGQKLRKLGWNASDTRELTLEDVEVPEENVLGEVDQGFPIFLDTLDGGRVGIAAHAIGIAQGALDETVRYTGERKQFKKKIHDFQGVRFMLAEAQTRIHAARLMMHQAARLRMAGKPHKKEAAMAKLFASETAMDVTTMAVQLHGGYGYSREYPVERMMRDAKITEIGEGTSEILKIVISREMLREAGSLD